MTRGWLLVMLVAALGGAAGCDDDFDWSDNGGGSDGDADADADADGDADGDTDTLEAARRACIDKINALRGAKGLPAYARWTAAESCVDGQATADEQSGSPHGAFQQCGESGQNECLGSGAAGIEGCLDSMWNEKDQAGCAGCDACADGYNPDCPSCDFYGDVTGDVCGHYVNMSAKYFTRAACGFSTLGGWATIDFQ